jgi:acyl-CoA thioesterase
MNNKIQAEAFFKNDIFATKTVGIVIDLAEKDHSVCSMDITHGHMNANNSVMGGAIFTLADFAFAVASNSEERGSVSLTSTISYLRPATGKRLTAECLPDKTGKRICTFTTTVTDENGKKIAVVTTSGFYADNPKS